MNELDDFIGKWRKLKQAGKEANLVLNTLAGNAWETLSVHLGHGGPSQHTHSRKHEDANVKDGPNGRVEKAVEMFAGKVKVSAGGSNRRAT